MLLTKVYSGVLGFYPMSFFCSGPHHDMCLCRLLLAATFSQMSPVLGDVPKLRGTGDVLCKMTLCRNLSGFPGRWPQRWDSTFTTSSQGYLPSTWFRIWKLTLITWLTSCLSGFFTVKWSPPLPAASFYTALFTRKVWWAAHD